MNQAIVCEYGPSDNFCTKIVVSIMKMNDDKIIEMKKWYSVGQDIRLDVSMKKEIFDFIKKNKVKKTISTGGIIGCPHEEGIDYPLGNECPMCPFWSKKSRDSN